MADRARVGLSRRLQLWTIARARRSRFLPVGIPDKLADEHRLGVPFSQPIMVFFATVQDSLYQLRPWYPALSTLAKTHPVVLVFKDSRTARLVRTETNFDCVTIARYGQLDAILAKSDVKLALYANHDPLNFEALRFTSMVHVYIGHGDSDKGVSVSNQIKAYDFCFVAGKGAVDRTSNQVMMYDGPARSVIIGQPQLDADQPDLQPSPDPRGRPTVLYAPTWEGAQPSVSYGSVESHGVALVRALVGCGAYRVIYRPHPLSGVHSGGLAAADAQIRDIVAATPGHRIDTANSMTESFLDADILICDVSAVSLNWLPSGKPLIVTKPTKAAANLAASKLIAAVPLLEPDGDVVSLVGAQLDNDPSKSERNELIEYYLSDPTPGVATAHFVDACTQVMATRDREWSALEARGAVKP